MTKLLIIDDHVPILQMLKRRLERKGFQVFLIEKVKKAEAILATEDIDLILLDYMMPEISGIDFFSSIHKKYNIPTIMMTAHASYDLVVEFLQKGGSNFIEKPIDINVLILKIQQSINLQSRYNKEKKARKKAEMDLRIANQKLLDKTEVLETVNNELNDFTSSISHDLKAPLRHIAMFTQMLKEKDLSSLDEEGLEFMDFIIDASKKMTKLITDLLAFSKMSNKGLKYEAIDTIQMVNNILHPLKEEQKNKNMTVEISDLPTINADRSLIRQVFANLIQNAVKYSSKSETPLIKITATQTNDYYTFSIKDNGVGFNMKYSDNLFKMFKRLHTSKEFEGTGVGLANVKRIINKHHGKVWAEAVLNEGATFHFSIPI